jgi:hypothetical protein
MFTIPSSDRRISQINESDVVGNVFATKNIDFDETGYIKLSPGMVNTYSTASDADFDQVQSMFHGSTSVYFIGNDVFKDSTIAFESILSNITTDTNPPGGGAEEDGAFFNGVEVVSDGTGIKYQGTSGVWTTVALSLTTAAPTCLEVFPAQNSLLVGNANTVKRINTSWATAVTLTLPTDYRVLSIAVNGSYAYIATRHTGNGEASLFIWTGVNATNDGSFGVGTFEISSVKAYGSSVALVTGLGQLLRFNGGGFDTLGNFPVYFSRSNWADALNDYGGLTNRGMLVDGDLIYIYINATVSDINKRHIYNMPAGIWCYDPKVGLYHKHSPTNTSLLKDLSVDAADINTTTNVITASGITVPATGTPVHYLQAASAIGGLETESWYYTIYVSSTTFKLAKTYDDALAGTAIDLTSTSDGNDFFFISYKDFGVTHDVSSKSSLMVLNNTELEETQIGRLIFSSQIANATGTEITYLTSECPIVSNRGYFITPKMFANSNTDVFNSLNLRFRPLKDDDKIIVKYRKEERVGLPNVPKSTAAFGTNQGGTWSSTTVFTTTAAPTRDYRDLRDVRVGDEVEILSGSGAGHIAHVSAISQSGKQWTVTLDEAAPYVTAADTMHFMVNNWTKLESIDATFEGTQKTIDVGAVSGWVQFKIEMRGVEVAIEDTIVNNKAFQKYN